MPDVRVVARRGRFTRKGRLPYISTDRAIRRRHGETAPSQLVFARNPVIGEHDTHIVPARRDKGDIVI